MLSTKQLTAEQRLLKATTAIIGNDEYVALSSVLMIGTKQVVDGLPTARTNGRDEQYGREFVDSLTDAELRFLMLHECYHKMYKHLITWKHLDDIDPHRSNRACDYVINQKLLDQDGGRGWIQMPEGGLADEKYRGMNAQQVFDLLEPEDDEGGSGGSGFDEHDWEGAQKLSPEELEELAKQIDEGIRQGAILAGKTGSGGLRDMGELLQTKQDWRELLRDFVVTQCKGNDYSTWKRPNRRYIGMDILMPSGISESVGEVVVAIDMSGSIGGYEVQKFLGELVGICEQVKPSKLRLLYWDTEVCGDEEYLMEEVASVKDTTKPKGGGGTSVSCVSTYLQEKSIKPQCVIVLTDGYLGNDWGTWSVPVLWSILRNPKTTAPNGVTVHID